MVNIVERLTHCPECYSSIYAEFASMMYVETVSKKNDTRVIRRGQAIGNTAIGIAQPPGGLLYITLVRDLFKFGTRASCSTIGLSVDTSDFFSTQTLL